MINMAFICPDARLNKSIRNTKPLRLSRGKTEHAESTTKENLLLTYFFSEQINY